MYCLTLFSLCNYCPSWAFSQVKVSTFYSAIAVEVIGSQQAKARELITTILISEHIGGWPGVSGLCLSGFRF